ncbi:MAG: ATP-binding protein [Acidobacteriota bacterium]
MNEKDIKELISKGESLTLDFKGELSDGFYKTISAFSNTKGGIILLGVGDKGKIVGVSPTNEFMERMTNRIIDKLTIYPEIEAVDVEEKRIIAVIVARSSFPISYEGRYYERIGNTTREMSQEKLRALLLKGKSWDLLTNNVSYEEIDIETIKRFVRLAVEKNRLPRVSLDEQPLVILEKLGLIVDGKLTNGAVILFGKDPQKHFINLCVRVGRLKTETTIIDDKWAKGNLFQQLEETINVLKQFISVRYEIKDWQREDIWDYPIPALREAVLNALIHRDYFNIANFIQIKVYDDHIWFFNLGGLPEGISIEELKVPHGSVLRNSLIAKAFYLAGEIEQYGSGTVRMVEWMKEAGLPEPEYKEEMGGFSVYFYSDIYTEENLRKMGLNERQIKAVMYVKEKRRITNKEYQELNAVSNKTAYLELIEIVKKDIFIVEGTGKNVIYTSKKVIKK